MNEVIQDQGTLGKSSKVYSPYILCRTLEVWQKILSINLPSEIRPLLEATYEERHEKENMARYKREMEKERDKLTTLALTGVSRGGKTLPESKASTRYSETESVEVLLIKKFICAENGTSLRLLDDSELLLPKFADAATRRQKASEILKNTVSAPVYLAPIAKTKQIEWLRNYVYLGDDEESPFRVAIVLESGELQGIGRSDVSDKYNVTYDSCLGYKADKKGGGVKTMENKFNLVDEPWIPVAGKGLVSLAGVFSDPSLSALGGNPVQKIALTKLLLAIAQAAYTPKDDEDWKNLGAVGMAKKALAYLTEKKRCFGCMERNRFCRCPK